jgi:MarR family transcriptional regulator, lower aerobic nicotinate degradation pathway regulator
VHDVSIAEPARSIWSKVQCAYNLPVHATDNRIGYDTEDDTEGAPLKLEDMSQSPGHLLRRAHQQATAMFVAACSEYDLTTVQYAALTTIDQQPGVDATRLSALIALDRSTIGGVMDRLESRGLILRAPDKRDRRVKLLFLTPLGKTTLVDAEARVLEVTSQILGPLKPAERTLFLRMLKVLVEGNARHDPDSVRSTLATPPSRTGPPQAKQIQDVS